MEEIQKYFFETTFQPRFKKISIPSTPQSHLESLISLWDTLYVDFYAKIFLILYTLFENSTTRIAIRPPDILRNLDIRYKFTGNLTTWKIGSSGRKDGIW